MAGKFAAGVFNELLKGEAGIRKSALKRSRAQAKFFRDIFQRGTLPGHGSAKGLLHMLADVCARVLSFQFHLQMRADHFQHLFVMRHEWCVQITATKNESVTVRFEMHLAAKMAFKDRAMLRRASEIDPERCDLAISAMTTHAQNPR